MIIITRRSVHVVLYRVTSG